MKYLRCTSLLRYEKTGDILSGQLYMSLDQKNALYLINIRDAKSGNPSLQILQKGTVILDTKDEKYLDNLSQKGLALLLLHPVIGEMSHRFLVDYNKVPESMRYRVESEASVKPDAKELEITTGIPEDVPEILQVFD